MIVVMKFGGSCLETAEKRGLACERIAETLHGGFKVCAVVSAMGRGGQPYATDTLVALANGVSKEVAPRELDLLISCGEIISAVLMVQELRGRGVPAMALSGGQAGIITDTNFGEASILSVDPTHVKRHLDEGNVVVVAGFQGQAESGDVTTLGRGGSDTTATALGAALDAAYVEIYTDVEGIMTADPRLVENARTIPLTTYDEVTQLAWEGARIIHPQAVEIAQRAQTPIWVRSLQKDSRKTLLSGGHKRDNPWLVVETARPVSGITYRSGLSLVSVENDMSVPDADGTALGFPAQLFDTLKDISLDLINVFPGKVSFVVPKDKASDVRKRLMNLGLPVSIEGDKAKVTVVGYGMHGRPGVMDTVIGALSKQDIRVHASSDSNITIACLIDEAFLPKAVNALHDAFRLSQIKKGG